MRIAHESSADSHAERSAAYKAAKGLYNDCGPDYLALVSADRYDFVEVCCSPNSELTATCINYGGKAYRINLANGFDMSTRRGCDAAKAWIRKHRPKEGWISLPCTPWSPMQNVTPMTPEREVKLASQRKHARHMIRLTIELVEVMVEVGCDPAWEWPLRASSWKLPEMEKLLELLPHKSRPDGCAFNMRAVDRPDSFILKSWRVQCRTAEQADRINIQCQGNHIHIPLEGSVRVNASSYYPKQMAVRFIRPMLRPPDMKDVCRRLLALDCEPVEMTINAVGKETTESTEPSKVEKDRIMVLLTKIHRNSAHCSNRNLARVLKDDGAPEWVIQLATDFKCDTCLCHTRPQIKPVASLSYETRLWHCVSVDQAELERSNSVVQFQLYHEKASGLCVPYVFFEREKGEHRNVTGQEVTDAFAEVWLSHYPKPARVVTDPEGAFQSAEFRDFLTSNDILYDPTAGEAHWQLDVERKIQTIKRIATKLSTDFPTASGKQILAAACSANNELERCRHYAPNQWAFGASLPAWEDATTSPASTFQEIMALRVRAQEVWLREKAHERLLTAQRAKTRSLTVYQAGQKVMVWRAGKGTKTKPGWGGKWFGPAVVLVHQSSPEGGPSKVVWVSLGGRLYRVAPEHLRFTTEREGLIFDMTVPTMDLEPNALLRTGEFTDLTGSPLPTTDDVEMGERVLPHQSPVPEPPENEEEVRRRIRKKRPDPTRTGAMEEEETIREDTEPKRTKSVVQLVFHVEDLDKFSQDPKKFLQKTKTRKAVEVSLRNLEGSELEEMEEAMAKELAEWLQEEALRVATNAELKELGPERLLKMRWVLTWKTDPTHEKGRKAKARIVVLGFQHPEVEDLQTASPTLGRTGKHLVLQWAAINKAIVESADAKSAFLQGDGAELSEHKPIYARAIAEVSAAFDIPEDSAIRIAKAVYGLGNAPRSWFFSVDRQLTNLGGKSCKSEHCIWVFHRSNGTTLALVGAYVDDFLIAGDHTDTEFLDLRRKISEMYRWGAWQKGTFVMCGVRIVQNLDYSFSLDQAKYVHDTLQLVEVPKGPERAATEREISQLRGAHGGLQWKVTQTGPQFAAALNALQGQVTKATTKTIKETNDLIKAAKAHDYPITIHHHDYCDWKELAHVTWTDAAQGDRPDGKSTGGYIAGFGRKDEIETGDWCPISLSTWNTSKLPRVARSSLAAEIQEACIAEDESYLVRLMWAEVNGVDAKNHNEAINLVPSYLVTDAKALYDAVQSETSALGLKERRSGIELAGLKENLVRNKTVLRWVNSGAMLADPMTKGKMRYLLEEFLRDPRWKLVDDPKFESFRKRKLDGGDAFDKPPAKKLEPESDSDPG